MALIYVDAPIFKKSPTGRKSYAHMVGTTLEEVHAFAERIGVKKHFWHKHDRLSHYDITAEQHAIAILSGAQLVSSRDLVAISYVMNGAPSKQQQLKQSCDLAAQFA